MQFSTCVDQTFGVMEQSNKKVVGGVFMDLSKAFEWVPHDLLYSYLSNRKQCFRINNVHSRFQNVISGAPQESIVGPTIINCCFNDFFYFIDKASVYDFADDNSLSAFQSNINPFMTEADII